MVPSDVVVVVAVVAPPVVVVTDVCAWAMEPQASVTATIVAPLSLIRLMCFISFCFGLISARRGERAALDESLAVCAMVASRPARGAKSGA